MLESEAMVTIESVLDTTELYNIESVNNLPPGGLVHVRIFVQYVES